MFDSSDSIPLFVAHVPDVGVSVNALLSERSYMLENEIYLVTVGGEFGLNCSTQSQFNLEWLFGDPPVRGWSNHSFATTCIHRLS